MTRREVPMAYYSGWNSGNSSEGTQMLGPERQGCWLLVIHRFCGYSKKKLNSRISLTLLSFPLNPSFYLVTGGERRWGVKSKEKKNPLSGKDLNLWLFLICFFLLLSSPSLCSVLFNFFLQCLKVIITQVFHLLEFLIFTDSTVKSQRPSKKNPNSRYENCSFELLARASRRFPKQTAYCSCLGNTRRWKVSPY